MPSLDILLVEDNEDDAVLLGHVLRQHGFDPHLRRVERAEALEAELDRRPWDVVISDFNLPSFSGLDAVRIFRRHHLDTPFLVWSGAVGEEMAAGLMREGARDFVRKDNLARLAPAIERELKEAAERQARRQAEEARASSEQRAREAMAEAEAARELEAFGTSVSHDLRAPLRSIDGFSQALFEDYGDRLDDAGRDYLRRIRTASMRMDRLLDDLLRLARLARTDLHVAPVDLSAIAREVVTELRHGAPDRRVEVAIQPGLEDQGDPAMLRVLLENLLGNAWKFTSRRPVAHVAFGAQEVDGSRTYFVRDDGAGFDMGYVDKLFRPFARLHPADAFPGTGVGLASVQRIVQRHRGRVWADGAPDQGATFHFTLGEEPT